jgi:WD40 repeat protein
VTSTRFRLPMSYETVCTADGRMFLCVGRRVNGFYVENCQRILSARPFPHPSHSDFSPDNKKVAVKYTNGRIVILDLSTGNVMRDYKNQREGEGSEAFFSPDGQELVDGSWNGLISIRKLSGPGVSTKQFPGEMIDRISHDSHKRSWLIQHKNKVQPGQKWPDYDYLVLHRWPLFGGKLKVFSFDNYLHSATISPDGSRICLICRLRGGGNWSMQVVRASDSKIIAINSEIEIGGTGSELAWSTDSNLVGSVQKRRFVFYRASDLATLGELPCQCPSSICFLPKDDLVVLSTWNSSALVSISDVLMGNVKMA